MLDRQFKCFFFSVCLCCKKTPEACKYYRRSCLEFYRQNKTFRYYSKENVMIFSVLMIRKMAWKHEMNSE